jgi:hypothetical protein
MKKCKIKHKHVIANAPQKIEFVCKLTHKKLKTLKEGVSEN